VRIRRLARDLLVCALAIVVAVLLQVTIAVDFSFLGGLPDLVCIAVISIALLRGPEAGAVAGFVAGFLLDAVSGQPLGLSSFVYTAVGYGAGRAGESVPDHAPVRPLVAMAVGAFVARAGVVALGAMIGSSVSVGEVLSIAAVPTAAITVLFAIPLYPVMRRALRRPRAVAAATTTPPSHDVSPIVA
jgi:rod shape-determining protein MreD